LRTDKSSFFLIAQWNDQNIFRNKKFKTNIKGHFFYFHNSFLVIIISTKGKFSIWSNIKNNKQLKSTMKRKKML
jgi:hypothetical protein